MRPCLAQGWHRRVKGQGMQCLSAGPRKYYPKDADSKLAVVWLILVQPLLFGAIGIEIDFRQIQGSLIWKTVIILALGQDPSPAVLYCPACSYGLALQEDVYQLALVCGITMQLWRFVGVAIEFHQMQ